jgi:site-specific DNA-methyltransferase (adenine-specific)
MNKNHKHDEEHAAPVETVIHVGGVERLAAALGPFDAVVCDPPYGLGFMGCAWDHAVPGPALWAQVLAACRPGAHLFAFGGARLYHRLACAIEEGGFEIRDCLMWLYGSGFPKSHNVGGGYGSALKPAWEPIVMARAPMRATIAGNVAEHGTGAINIDGARIATSESAEDIYSGTVGPIGGGGIYGGSRPDRSCITGHDGGRWPANLILDEVAGRALDQQSGRITTTKSRDDKRENRGASMFLDGRRHAGNTHNDTGGASRFFYCPKATREEREAGLAGFDAAIVNNGRETSIDNACQRGDTLRKNLHPTVKPVDLTRWLATLALPPKQDRPRRVLVPFSGSGSEMIGCLLAGFDEVIGIEIVPKYADIARARIKHWRRYRSAQSDAAEAEAAGQMALF